MASPLGAQAFSVVGGYGFDWLEGESAQCRRIARAEADAFGKCRFFPAGDAFGLPSSYHVCVAASGGREYFVYESRLRCIEALETMKANGP
jgi:hypothetical protein